MIVEVGFQPTGFNVVASTPRALPGAKVNLAVGQNTAATE
jgi:hypothetical protein